VRSVAEGGATDCFVDHGVVSAGVREEIVVQGMQAGGHRGAFEAAKAEAPSK
jgi:hypothetical protein